MQRSTKMRTFLAKNPLLKAVAIILAAFTAVWAPVLGFHALGLSLENSIYAFLGLYTAFAVFMVVSDKEAETA